MSGQKTQNDTDLVKYVVVGHDMTHVQQRGLGWGQRRRSTILRTTEHQSRTVARERSDRKGIEASIGTIVAQVHCDTLEYASLRAVVRTCTGARWRRRHACLQFQSKQQKVYHDLGHTES